MKILEIEEQLNSNKKRHKVKITNVAISKVPSIKYKEIPIDEHKIINDLAKKVLTIAKDENNSNEVAITYKLFSKNAKGNIGIELGTENEADPLNDTISYHIIMKERKCVVVSLHNHPALSIISIQDIRFLLEYNSIKLMVVVTNKGKLSYIVKNDKYNKDDSIRLFNEIVTKYNKAKKLKDKMIATSLFFKECKKCGLIYVEGKGGR